MMFVKGSRGWGIRGGRPRGLGVGAYRFSEARWAGAGSGDSVGRRGRVGGFAGQGLTVFCASHAQQPHTQLLECLG